MDMDVVELRKALEERKEKEKKEKSDSKKTEPAVKKQEETTKECPGGNKPCKDCEPPYIITVEDILAASAKKSEASGKEAIAPLFKDVIPERHCCSDGGGPCCCGEE